jgi:hypothetical protein
VTDDALVVHLVNVPNFWKGRTDPKLAVGGIVAGLAVIVGAAMREATTGEGNLLTEVLVAVAIVGLLVSYGYLRLWNATLFVRSGKVGVTNWLGLSRTARVESVDHFRRTAEVWTGERLPRGVLFIVTKDRKHSIRFGGGDRLEPGGLERIAAMVGAPIEGWWTDLPTWRP